MYQTQLLVGLFLQPLHDSTGSRGSTAPRTLGGSSKHVLIFCCVRVCLFPMCKDDILNGYSKTSYMMMRSMFDILRCASIFRYSYKKTFRNNFSQHVIPSSHGEVFIYHLQLQLLPWHVPLSWSCPLPYFFGASSHVPRVLLAWAEVVTGPVRTSHRSMVENMRKNRSKCGHSRPVPWHLWRFHMIVEA